MWILKNRNRSTQFKNKRPIKIRGVGVKVKRRLWEEAGIAETRKSGVDLKGNEWVAFQSEGCHLANVRKVQIALKSK